MVLEAAKSETCSLIVVPFSQLKIEISLFDYFLITRYSYCPKRLCCFVELYLIGFDFTGNISRRSGHAIRSSASVCSERDDTSRWYV